MKYAMLLIHSIFTVGYRYMRYIGQTCCEMGQLQVDNTKPHVPN